MKRTLWSLAMAAALAAPSVVLAQTTKPAAEPAEKSVEGGADIAVATTGPAAAEDPNTGGLTLSGGVDFVTAYFFRGYNQEDGGLIAQPYITLTAAIASTDDYTLNAYVATWNSFQSAQTLASGSGPAAFYENDIYGGLDLVLGKFTVGALYTFYQYPNGAFQTIQEVGFKFGYDDTELMKGAGVNFALKPFAGIYIETSDGNGTDDTYAEVGIAPSFAVDEGKITLSFPVVLGLSIDHYYLDADGENEIFGYGGISALATIPLPIPEKYGAWSLTGGVQYLQLFANSAAAANNGDWNQFIGKLGIGFSY